jgi:flagellar motor protein MotB
LWQVVYLDFITTVMVFFFALWVVSNGGKGEGLDNKLGDRSVQPYDLSGNAFGSGSTSLNSHGVNALEIFVKNVKSGLNMETSKSDAQRSMLYISGHTDDIAAGDGFEGKSRNLSLGFGRAMSVLQFLAQKQPDIVKNVAICSFADNLEADPVPAGMRGKQTLDAKTRGKRANNRRITLEKTTIDVRKSN